MGMIAFGGLSTIVSAEPEFLWDIPEGWSMEDSVTVPVVYGNSVIVFVIQQF